MRNEKLNNCVEREQLIQPKIYDKNGNITNANKKRKYSNVPKPRKALVKQKKKRPLPMKMRDLPSSFWKQPNQPKLSPEDIFFELSQISIDTISNCDTAGTVDCNDVQLPLKLISEKSTTPANTDLLFSLFRVVDTQTATSMPSSRTVMPKRESHPWINIRSVSSPLLRDASPCLSNSIFLNLRTVLNQTLPSSSVLEQVANLL